VSIIFSGENMSKNIETVLESFVKGEIAATESRIVAIRTFLDTLRAELFRYTSEVPTDPADKAHFAMILKLFKSMISTYDDEIQMLIAKRERMLDHLLNIRSVVTHLRPKNDMTDLHIN
jgi:DNA repair ATPase RecN